MKQKKNNRRKVHDLYKIKKYLYKRIERYLRKNILPELTPIKIEILSKPISIEKIKISNFYPTKKAQGPDDFTGKHHQVSKEQVF